MATVTKPIALNESFVSTELTPRTVADILAEELPRITGRDASQVSYDNTASGLTASDVQDALDEIVGDIPTVNDGTLTIQQNGVTKASFSANTASNVTADIEIPAADEKTATDEFTTANGGLLSECNVTLAPVQDLHGYDNPWVGGAGKNKANLEQGSLDLSDGSEIPSTTRVRTNFIGVQVGQTYIASSENNGWSIRNGCTYDANKNFISNGVYPDPSDGTITIPSGVSYVRFIYSHSDTSEICTPDDYWYQFEQGSTATSYEPYSNICPISGHTEVDLDVKDGDDVTQHTYQVQIGSTVYGGTVDLVSGVMNVTHVFYTDDGSANWIKNLDGSFYASYTPDYPLAVADATNCCCNYAPVAVSFNGMDVYPRPNGLMSLSKGWGNIFADATALKTAFSNTPIQVVYKLATPQTIQLTPQQIEALVDENNLSAPLDGQTLEGVKYKELFTFDDVKSYVDKKIPDAPTTDGTYTLQAVVSGGVPTYSWV